MLLIYTCRVFIHLECRLNDHMHHSNNVKYRTNTVRLKCLPPSHLDSSRKSAYYETQHSSEGVVKVTRGELLKWLEESCQSNSRGVVKVTRDELSKWLGMSCQSDSGRAVKVTREETSKWLGENKKWYDIIPTIYAPEKRSTVGVV